MKDKNEQDRRNTDRNLMYQLGLHPEDLPGRYLHIPHPKTGLHTHITIGKLLNDYGEAFKKHPNCQAHFEIKFTRDEKKNIMSHNNIVDHMNQDKTLHESEYW